MTDPRLVFAANLAREAGLLAQEMRRRPGGLEITRKGPQDFVTAADLAVERLVQDRIARAFPQDGLLGEEGGLRAAAPGAGLWIVDPVDGTTNFLRGLADWGVSIALAGDGGLTHGAIFLPDLDLLAVAGPGQPALLNGRPTRVSDRAEPDQTVVALGTSEREPIADYLARLGRLRAAGCEYRRAGAATVGLMGVITGRIEAYHEAFLNIWDAAAGLVLVRAAGGLGQHGDLAAHLAAPSEVLVWNGRNGAVADLLLSRPAVPVTGGPYRK
jgi:myo-inositol-1(or 4)-monophosphatase